MKAAISGLAGAALAACFIILTPQIATADGITVAEAQIPEAERNQLWSQIEAYRATNPGAFEAVRNVKGHRPEHYKKRRNPIPYVFPELRRLRRGALLPMLEALAFQAPERGALTAREWRALEVGLLGAVGVLRDARASTVLQRAFDNASHPQVVRAAGEALGRLCDSRAFKLLSKHAASGVKKEGAIRGLGQCRRVDSTEQLAQMLASAKDPAEAAVVAEALGVAASSWAWQAYGPAAQAQGLEVRRIAATALVPAFIRHGGKAREAIRVGLTMAEHPGTAQLVQQHRHQADEATARVLDRIVMRIERRLNR